MMKEIRLKKVDILYFKGIRQMSLEFGPLVTAIKGCNGLGKTTIGDAVVWCLFGTDMTGNTKFSLKTKQEDGSEIGDVEHSVTLAISVNGEDVTLKRMLKDSVSQSGSVTNTYSYFVDGEVQTAGDYKKVIEEICSYEIFKLCSSPTAFVSQDWKKQRDTLVELVGNPSFDEIVAGKAEKFKRLKDSKKSTEEQAKHLEYKRKEVKNQLDEIPTRLQELENVLPKKEDWPTIEKEIEVKKQELEEKSRLLIETKSGSNAGKKKQLHAKLDFALKRKMQMEIGARNEVYRITVDKQEAINAIKQNIAILKESAGDIKRKQDSLIELIKRCEVRQQELEVEKQEGAALWKTVSGRQWQWNDNDSFCPTCGQQLPTDRLEELKTESRTRFNASLAEEKKKLQKKALAIKSDLNTLTESVVKYHTEQDEAKEKAKQLAEQVKKEEEKYQECIKQVVPTEADILANKPSYTEVCEEVKSVEAQFNDNTDNADTEFIKQLEADKADIENALHSLEGKMVSKKQYEQVSARMESIKEERSLLQAQMDELDEQYDIVTEFGKLECQAIERKVNKYFKLVRWSMFQKRLDGTRSPWCQCTINGVPYQDLNTASKINAGLDIVHFFKEKKQVDVPCFVDCSESILHPMYDGGQQIRMIVTSDEKIKVEYEN